ncbi:hypothetical protein GCM10028857_18240 [Salinarchaeum chitinilyticum]
MFSVSSVGALLDELEAATDGLHADGGEPVDPDGADSGSDQSEAEQDDADQSETEPGDADQDHGGDSPADDTATDDGDPGTRTAVVDRIENETAVVLFEDGSGTETVPAAVLPEAAREEGMVLDVPDGTSLALATVDHAETAERREEAQDQFDELAEQPPDSDAANGTANP